MIKEPDKVPVYHADETASARVGVLLSIVANTANYPKLKPLHDEALMELEVLGEEGRVRLLKYSADVKARDVEIARLRAEEAAKVQAEEEARVREQQKAEGAARVQEMKGVQSRPGTEVPLTNKGSQIPEPENRPYTPVSRTVQEDQVLVDRRVQ